MRRFLIRFAITVVGLCGVNLCGIVGISYRCPIDNDPLLNPIQVAAFDDDRLSLADGRSVRTLLEIAPYWQEDLKARTSVDIEIDASNRVTVYGRKRIFYCGIGDPFMVIPLVPFHVKKWQRATIACGEIDGLPVIYGDVGCDREQHVDNNNAPDS